MWGQGVTEPEGYRWQVGKIHMEPGRHAARRQIKAKAQGKGKATKAKARAKGNAKRQRHVLQAQKAVKAKAK